MSEPENAADILHEAACLVSGDRAEKHGDAVESFAKIAAIWNAILFVAGKAPAAPLDGHDVASLMEGMKMSRRYCGTHHADDFVDGAGYAALAFQLRVKSIDGGKS